MNARLCCYSSAIFVGTNDTMLRAKPRNSAKNVLILSAVQAIPIQFAKAVMRKKARLSKKMHRHFLLFFVAIYSPSRKHLQ